MRCILWLHVVNLRCSVTGTCIMDHAHCKGLLDQPCNREETSSISARVFNKERLYYTIDICDRIWGKEPF